MPVLFFSGDTLPHDLGPNARLSTILSHTLDHWQEYSLETGLKKDVEESQKLSIALDGGEKAVFFPPPSFFPSCIRSDNCPVSSESQLADVTLKLFLPESTTVKTAVKALTEALNAHSQYLKPHKFKSLIISFEGLSFADCVNTDYLLENEQLAEIWRQLTHVANKIATIQEYGVSELSTWRLKLLFENIEAFKDPSIPYPSIDHINAADCCALPPALILFSKKRNIRLLANHDPEKMLCHGELKELVEKTGVATRSDIKWNWILRMTAVVPNRQVLTANKYLVSMGSN
jgi:hypothetical protein